MCSFIIILLFVIFFSFFFLAPPPPPLAHNIHRNVEAITIASVAGQSRKGRRSAPETTHARCPPQPVTSVVGVRVQPFSFVVVVTRSCACSRCIEHACGESHPEDAGALIESIAEKLRTAGLLEASPPPRGTA